MYLQFWYLPNGRLNFYYWDAKQSDSRWVALNGVRCDEKEKEKTWNWKRLTESACVSLPHPPTHSECHKIMDTQTTIWTETNAVRASNNWTNTNYGEQNHRKFIGIFFFFVFVPVSVSVRLIRLRVHFEFKRYEMTRRLFPLSLFLSETNKNHFQSRSHSCVARSERLPTALAGYLNAVCTKCRCNRGIVWRKTPRFSPVYPISIPSI